MKRYWLNVVEEAVLNPDYQWGRGGRIEVNDTQNTTGYPIEEYRFFVPVEMFAKFFEAFDGVETDYPVRVDMNWK